LPRAPRGGVPTGRPPFQKSDIVPVQNICPSASQFLDLVQGQSPADERAHLAAHVLECRDCARSLQRLEVSDTFRAELRATATDAERTLSSEVQDLVGGPGSALSSACTPLVGAADNATIGEDKEPAYDGLWSNLLQPPQGPDELGWLGQYRVLKVLGAGGMGRVFLAEDTHLRRPVALKVMSPHLQEIATARERFLREARSAAALRDDRIVTIYQVGQVDNVPFLAMELLEGESLEARLRRETSLTPDDVIRFGIQIAEGLAVAHEQGLVHRDIKPANLWLESKRQATGAGPHQPPRVKILDFGLARAAQSPTSLTTTGQVLGTPHYMAPEQARGEPVDPRSDLFSLGCVLYRMAAGREPFRGESMMAVLTALAVEEPPSLREIQPRVSAGLAQAIEHLLRKNRDDRPANARAVIAELQAVEQGRPLALDDKTVRIVAAPSKPRRLAMPRRSAILAGVVCAFGAVLAGFFLLGQDKAPDPAPPTHPAHVVPPPVFTGPPIRVGILQSLSGTMADSGMSVVDATVLAIEELNDNGGLLGRKIEYFLRDGQSDSAVFAQEAERLIIEDKVEVLFGCWTSAGRKEVKRIVEKHDHLLFYPVQYEGLELSPNIIYLGGTPNQQIVPAVQYFFANLDRRRFFLVGSDYVFPRAANEIIKDELKKLGGAVVGETYISLGDSSVQGVVDQIIAAKPDVILNTINGDTNRAFFRALRRAGITPDKVPTISFSISEHELRALGGKEMVGDYAAWDYFMSMQGEDNDAFIKKFRARYGAERLTSDPLLAGYESVYLWAKAVQQAGSTDPAKVRVALRTASIETIGGELKLEPDTLHAWRPFRLGKIVEGSVFEVVWTSGSLIRPEPYFKSRTPAVWDRYLSDLYEGWGRRWENPNP